MEYQNYGKVQIRLYFVAYCNNPVLRQNEEYSDGENISLLTLQNFFITPNTLKVNGNCTRTLSLLLAVILSVLPAESKPFLSIVLNNIFML